MWPNTVRKSQNYKGGDFFLVSKLCLENFWFVINFGKVKSDKKFVIFEEIIGNPVDRVSPNENSLALNSHLSSI